MADEEKSGLEIDDWLDDLQNEEPEKQGQGDAAELDQSDIDSLLGGGDTAEGAAIAEQAAEAEDAAELDQSDIDSLLGGGPSKAAPPAAAKDSDNFQDDFAELDQSDIDSLLGGGETVEKAAAAAGAAETEIDQSDIDDLFAEAGGPAPEVPAATEAEKEGEAEPTREDVDQLFSDIDEAAGAETVSFTEVLGEEKEEGGDESFGLNEADFGDEDFGFDDNIPEIPDDGTVGLGSEEEKGEGFFADEATAQELADYLDQGPVAATAGEKSPPEEKKFTLPLPIAMSKTILAATALCIVLLVGGFAFFFLRGEKQEPAVPIRLQERQLAEQQGLPAESEAESAVNETPVVQGGQYSFDEATGAVSIQLSGKDGDNDPLEYAIVSPPKYGRLSGDSPNLTYLPNKDFPGEDSFDFRASDGKDVSNLAKIFITGPKLVQTAVREKKVLTPKTVIVGAKNIKIDTVSTEPVIIDWQKIWQRANKEPFSSKVGVEIVSEDLRGTLTKIGPGKHRYTPDKFFGGTETMEYRFQFGGAQSKVRQLLLSIQLGDPAPEIRLKPLAEAYPVGSSVVLDVRETRDDAPGTLAYSWEQVSGVPVQMEVLSEDASVISFVVPSSFYKEGEPQTVIKVTAIDRSGQRASENIMINSVSRYQSALWRGLPSGTVQYEPHCPNGECPGGLLPWNYPD